MKKQLLALSILSVLSLGAYAGSLADSSAPITVSLDLAKATSNSGITSITTGSNVVKSGVTGITTSVGSLNTATKTIGEITTSIK